MTERCTTVDGACPRRRVLSGCSVTVRWSHKGTTEWVQYDLDRPRKVSVVEVYWFDDTGRGGCRLPNSWRVLVREDGQWRSAHNAVTLKAEKDKFNTVELKPVTTDAVRIEVQLQPDYSGGILEWRVR